MRRLPGRLKRIPTILRTLRWIKPTQGWAQIRHTLFGLAQPSRLDCATPVIGVNSGGADFLPPPTHVRESTPREIEMVGAVLDLDDLSPDWETQEHGPLFAYHLHQHEYLRTEAFDPAQRQAVMLDWIEQHKEGTGWDPHPISLRLLCWGKMLISPLVLDLDPAARAQVLSSMADQAETLAQGLEVRLQANHLLSNLLSVVWAGILLECEASVRWRALTDRLIAEIDAQVHPDGGHEERSPMYHGLLLENMLDLLNLCRGEPDRAPPGLVETLERTTARMLSAFAFWTHPDGEIALFADSAFDIAAPFAKLAGYAKRLGVDVESQAEAFGKSRVLTQSGYIRLVAADVVLVASTAGPSPLHQPGHAHCDALSFEISIGGQRIVTDTGLFEYRPGVRRDRARTTASHSTFQFDGEEQAEVWSAHRVGGRPSVELLGWNEEDTAEASCSGWSRAATLHRRRFEVEAGMASIHDRIEGDFDSVRFCLPIDPAWVVDLRAGSLRATLTRSASAALPPLRAEIELPSEFRWRLESGPYYPRFGQDIERVLIVGEGAGFESSTLRVRMCS